MYEYYPLLIIGALIGLFSIVFIIAYVSIKDKKEAILGYYNSLQQIGYNGR